MKWGTTTLTLSHLIQKIWLEKDRIKVLTISDYRQPFLSSISLFKWGHDLGQSKRVRQFLLKPKSEVEENVGTMVNTVWVSLKVRSIDGETTSFVIVISLERVPSTRGRVEVEKYNWGRRTLMIVDSIESGRPSMVTDQWSRGVGKSEIRNY